MVACDHDHPDAGLVAGAYRSRHISPRRILKADEAQECQSLERRTILGGTGAHREGQHA
jgi:hypothetical protein